MTDLPFVAELHDIGKLMDVECLPNIWPNVETPDGP